MGRIKTAKIKRITFELLKEHKGEFSDNFEENKKIVEKYLVGGSKRVRNPVAGYITRLVKSKRIIL